MNEQLKYFVGIDWGAENHRVIVLNRDGRVIERYNAPHSGKGLENLVDRLRKVCQCPPIEVGIALEVSWGALVETVAEAGFSVFSINPKQSDRFRDRHTAAGAKDDSRDALVLGSALRTDQKSFKRVQVDDPATIRLRELSRQDEELKNDLRRATNQLWEQLHRYFPQMLKLSSGADDPFVWDLLSKAPMPAKAAKLTASRVSHILASRRISRITAVEVVAILREPSLQPALGAAEAASEHVLLLLPRLALLDQQIRDVARRIGRALRELPASIDPNGKPCKHRDVDLLLSLPGLGQTIASTIPALAALTRITSPGFQCIEANWQVPPRSPITSPAPPLRLKSKRIPPYSRISRRSMPVTIWSTFLMASAPLTSGELRTAVANPIREARSEEVPA